MSKLDPIDEELREIAEKFGTPETNGNLLQVLKDFKERIIDLTLEEIESSYKSVREKISKTK